MTSNESPEVMERDIGWLRVFAVRLTALADSRGGIPHLSAARKNSRSSLIRPRLTSGKQMSDR